MWVVPLIIIIIIIKGNGRGKDRRIKNTIQPAIQYKIQRYNVHPP